MKKFDVCVFDLDGTLINSLTDLAVCVNEALSLHSLPVHPLKEYKQFVGNGARKLITRAMNNRSSDEELYTSVYKAFNMLYNEKCLDKTRPYVGITGLLSKLKENDIKLCILSNKPDEYVKRIVDNLFEGISFDLVWGKKDEYPTKPDPASLLAMLDKLNCSQERCLYIGDSNVDVITAKNADIKFCGVEWGFRGIDELINTGADVVVKKPCEILGLVINNA